MSQPAAPKPLTDKQRTEEVASPLAAAGLPWIVRGLVRSGRDICTAEVTHQGPGRTRIVSISSTHFPTRWLRRAELVRLLRDGR